MENHPGGWVINPTVNMHMPEMSDSQISMFEAAFRDMDGAGFTPLLYLGSQTVAGTLHAWIAQRRLITSHPVHQTAVKVVIFESLDKKLSVHSISEI